MLEDKDAIIQMLMQSTFGRLYVLVDIHGCDSLGLVFNAHTRNQEKAGVIVRASWRDAQSIKLLTRLRDLLTVRAMMNVV